MKLIFVLLACAFAQKLIGLIEVCRHCARAPIGNYKFEEGLWPWGLGQCTPSGLRMHYLNGYQFRRRYIVQHQLFGPFYDPAEVMVRSTDVNRTIMSAQSQLYGLFPDGPSLRTPELNSTAVPPISINNLYNITHELGQSALLKNYQPIGIYTEQQELDHLLTGYSTTTCPRMKEILAQVVNGTEYKDREQIYIEDFKDEVFQLTGLNLSFVNAGYLGDTMLCNQYEGYPQLNTDLGLYDELTGINNYTMNMPYTEEGMIISCSDFFNEVSSIFNQTISGETKRKFSFFSAHDTTLTAFLNCLGVPIGVQPVFASTLLFELWEDAGGHLVKVIFNDQVMDLPGCGGNSPCPYDTFTEVLMNKTTPDIKKACQLQGDIEIDSSMHELINLILRE